MFKSGRKYLLKIVQRRSDLVISAALLMMMHCADLLRCTSTVFRYLSPACYPDRRSFFFSFFPAGKARVVYLGRRMTFRDAISYANNVLTGQVINTVPVPYNIFLLPPPHFRARLQHVQLTACTAATTKRHHSYNNNQGVMQATYSMRSYFEVTRV